MKKTSYTHNFLLFYNFIRPVDDAAEFFYIGVAEFNQFFRCDFTSSTATAVDKYKLFFVGQFFFGTVGNLVFRD